VVVWNVTRRCNLACQHCYASARRSADPGELSPAEGRALLAELARCRVPAIIFSGGDPLLRDDLLDLVRATADLGIHPAVSTNGTLVDAGVARRLRQAGAGYVGVSIDGIGAVHDRFRGRAGAYEEALRGLRHCRDAGITVGLRFTLSRPTAPDLGRALDLMEAERVQRGYVSHLVYVGRAHRLAPHALTAAETRAAVEAIVARAIDLHDRGVPLDLVTGNSDADGVFLYLRTRSAAPARAEALRALLRRRGGNSAGVAIASVDDRGGVHPDQFWPHHALGSVRQRPFGDIWRDPAQPLLARLRNRRAHVHGRCARCPFFDLCGGGNRVRAESLTGDLWASDPACYLTDDELGLGPGQEAIHAATADAGPEPAAGGAALLPECAAVGAGG
jgi:radical SAM protein with 4Fe4S-binding SPASM domain